MPGLELVLIGDGGVHTGLTHYATMPTPLVYFKHLIFTSRDDEVERTVGSRRREGLRFPTPTPALHPPCSSRTEPLGEG